MNTQRKNNGSDSIIGFYGADEEFGCFSNWYNAPFELAGTTYASSEQYMMCQKVLAAEEYDLADKIMSTADPAKAKKYAGASYFKSYDKIKEFWEKNRKPIVKRGVRAKFAQNPELLQKLLQTGNALLCECAPRDTVWGIGIGLNDSAWHDVRKWRGSNVLGRILMELRTEFQYEITLWGAVQNEDYRDAKPITVWNMPAGQLKRIPEYYTAIHTYADKLDKTPGGPRSIFYYGDSLSGIDEKMRINMGAGFPKEGFYEMKQEVYEIAKRLSGKRDISEL